MDEDAGPANVTPEPGQERQRGPSSMRVARVSVPGLSCPHWSEVTPESGQPSLEQDHEWNQRIPVDREVAKRGRLRRA